ncbi:TIGR04222 domain-containing membrane protein [Planotetraspora kaengkrachanensis]|uniref:TIGR04222 domain-containing membrane protein n=1 Tax=Planotetraspora kaengkrachanensis TaxID=575193 RepID=A0A8J3M6G3_9ACTN|nr:TIGR04222 domain-containing membrane protein [Planotetraspora kaengkrachanensis]GIG80275.1 hypothetical protein Pka01_34020 [Planotetraspora kaengkrachanensis]
MEFALLVVAVVVAVLAWNAASAFTREHRRIRSISGFSRDDLTHYELAYLAGGPRRVINTAIALLVERELVRVARGGRVTVVAGAVPPTEGVERAVLDLAAAPGGRSTSEIRHEVAAGPAMTDLKLRLIAKGLLLPDGALNGPRAINTRLGFLVALAFVVTAVNLMFLLTGRLPWSPAFVAAMLVAGVTAVAGLRARRRYSRSLPGLLTMSGREALETAQARNARTRAEPASVMADGALYTGVAGGVALYGLGAMPDQTVATEIDRERDHSLNGPSGSSGCASGSCGGGVSGWGTESAGSDGGHSCGGHSGCGGGSSCGGGGCGGGCGGGS